MTNIHVAIIRFTFILSVKYSEINTDISLDQKREITSFYISSFLNNIFSRILYLVQIFLNAFSSGIWVLENLLQFHDKNPVFFPIKVFYPSAQNLFPSRNNDVYVSNFPVSTSLQICSSLQSVFSLDNFTIPVLPTTVYSASQDDKIYLYLKVIFFFSRECFEQNCVV